MPYVYDLKSKRGRAIHIYLFFAYLLKRFLYSVKKASNILFDLIQFYILVQYTGTYFLKELNDLFAMVINFQLPLGLYSCLMFLSYPVYNGMHWIHWWSICFCTNRNFTMVTTIFDLCHYSYNNFNKCHCGCYCKQTYICCFHCHGYFLYWF